jgi:hypothetical protein
MCRPGAARWARTRPQARPAGASGSGRALSAEGLVVVLGEAGADLGGAELLVHGDLPAEAGEDVQRGLPMPASPVAVAQGVVGAGEAVGGTGLVDGLSEGGGELERRAVAGEGLLGAPRGGVEASHAVHGFEHAVVVAQPLGEAEAFQVGALRARAGPAPGGPIPGRADRAVR